MQWTYRLMFDGERKSLFCFPSFYLSSLQRTGTGLVRIGESNSKTITKTARKLINHKTVQSLPSKRLSYHRVFLAWRTSHVRWQGEHSAVNVDSCCEDFNCCISVVLHAVTLTCSRRIHVCKRASSISALRASRASSLCHQRKTEE